MGGRSTHSRGLPLQPRVDRHCDRPAGAARPCRGTTSRPRLPVPPTNERARDVLARRRSSSHLVGLAFMSLMLLTMETGWQLMIDSATSGRCQGSQSLRQHGHNGGRGDHAAAARQRQLDSGSARPAELGRPAAGQTGCKFAASELRERYAAVANDAAHVNATTGPGTASQVVQYTITYTQPYLTPIAAAITGQPADDPHRASDRAQ